MTANQLIALLHAAVQRHGDLEVLRGDADLTALVVDAVTLRPVETDVAGHVTPAHFELCSKGHRSWFDNRTQTWVDFGDATDADDDIRKGAR